MDIPTEIEALLRRKGIPQSVLAKYAGVSQPTVSRAMRRIPTRRSQEYARLCRYIHQELNEVALPSAARDALAEIWDGSPAHAEALTALIKVAGELSRTRDTKDNP